VKKVPIANGIWIFGFLFVLPLNGNVDIVQAMQVHQSDTTSRKNFVIRGTSNDSQFVLRDSYHSDFLVNVTTTIDTVFIDTKLGRSSQLLRSEVLLFPSLQLVDQLSERSFGTDSSASTRSRNHSLREQVA
jgi:hypothetical protein